MRVLVLSDVHGNSAALDVVTREPHDAVVCLGDLVGFGPDPAVCLAWARAQSNVLILGDHDRAAAGGPAPGGRPALRALAAATTSIAAAQLCPADVGFLNSLPARAHFRFDGVQYMAVHGTPSNPWYRSLGPDVAEWAEELYGLKVNMLLVGHTHVQFRLAVGGIEVINPGSVGQPLDGDARAAYVIIEDGLVHMGRAAYAVEQTVERLQQVGVDPAWVRASGALWRTGRVASMFSELPTHLWPTESSRGRSRHQ